MDKYFAATLVVALAFGPEASGDCVLSDEQLSSMKDVEDSLASQRRRTEAWKTSWGGLLMGAAVYQAYEATRPEDERGNASEASLWVGAVRSLIASASFAITPSAADIDRSPYTCEGFKQSQKSLARGIRLQKKGKSLGKHLTVVGYNAVFAIYLGAVHGEWKEAGVGMLIGVAVGELQILTQPNGLKRIGDRGKLALSPWLSRESQGLMLVGSF